MFAGLQQRDLREKVPFVGVLRSLSQMEERLEMRQKILDDFQSKSLEKEGSEAERNVTLLQLCVKESELKAEKLSASVSDLTALLNLKEAELQYWQSRMSQYRQEALTLAKKSNSMKTTLSEFEYVIECQSKELVALRIEQKDLKEALDQNRTEKERLLQRWIEEKSEEADRLNDYNHTQERLQHLAKHVKKHLRREMKKEGSPISTNSPKEASPPVIQRSKSVSAAQQASPE